MDTLLVNTTKHYLLEKLLFLARQSGEGQPVSLQVFLPLVQPASQRRKVRPVARPVGFEGQEREGRKSTVERAV